MTDVLLRHTADGGSITITGGLCQLSEGLETASYLSMFGGNEQDAGDADTTLQWWGNIEETEAARTYRGETQNLIKSLPAVPANLLRIEQAAERDHAWMIEAGIATAVKVTARIPALNRVAVDVEITTLAEVVQFTFG